MPFSISSSNVYAQPCAFGYIEMVFSVGSEKNAITFLESNKTFPTLWFDRNLKAPKMYNSFKISNMRKRITKIII